MTFFVNGQNHKDMLTIVPVIVSRTLGGAAARIDVGKASPLVQETASSVYHVIQGSGYTTIGGNKFSWEKSDTFCIPSWHPYQHFASDNGDGAPVIPVPLR